MSNEAIFEKDELENHTFSLSLGYILQILEDITRFLSVTPDRLITEREFIVNLDNRFANCINEVAKNIEADTWIVFEDPDRKKETNNQEPFFDCSDTVRKINKKVDNREKTNLQLLDIVKLLGNTPNKFYQISDSKTSVEISALLENLNVNCLAVFQEFFIEKKLFVCLGRSKTSGENDPIDFYQSDTIKFVRKLMRLIAEIIGSYMVTKAFDNYTATVKSLDPRACVKSAEQLIWVKKIDIQSKKFFTMINSQSSRNQELENDLDRINDPYMDDIIANYIRSLLWSHQSKRYQERQDFFQFRDLWLCFSTEMWEISGSETNLISDLFTANNIGFFITDSFNSQVWIPIGPRCKKAFNEIYIVYEFLYHQLQFFITAKRKDIDSVENITDYKKWMSKFEQFQKGLIISGGNRFDIHG